MLLCYLELMGIPNPATLYLLDMYPLLMDEFPNVESDAWSIIFQSNNPGTNCPKTTKFINKRTK